MDKKKNTAILKIVKDIFKTAKIDKREKLTGKYCTIDNYNVISDGYRILATTAEIDGDKDQSLNYLAPTVEATADFKKSVYLPYPEQLKEAIDKVKAIEKQKIIVCNLNDEITVNAVWLLSAIQAVKAAELKYYDCRHQAIIEDDYSKFVFMPIAKMYFDKNNRKKWTISTPADHAFIYVDKNGVPEVIDRRPAAEPQEAATA